MTSMKRIFLISCLLFLCVALGFIFLNSKKEKVSVYDLCLSPELPEKYDDLYLFDHNIEPDEYPEYIKKAWEEAEFCYDEKKYKDAIYNYKDVLVIYAYKRPFPEFNYSFKEYDEDYKTRYFSLYNIACCYSLLGNKENAETFLIKALESGYPYIDHIMMDEDLINLFNSKPQLKETIKNIFNKGYDKNILIGETIKYCTGPTSGIDITFLNERDVIYEPWSEGTKKYQHKYHGTYSFKNYYAIISFYKEEYCDMSKSEAYYEDIRNKNYTKVVKEINDTMVLPLSLEENAKIFLPFL